MRRTLAPSALIALLASACGDPATCLGGDPTCVMASPCEEVAFECDASGFTEAFVIGPEHPLPVGVAALASDGDVVLANDRIIAVIDALDHPHYIAPTGGGIVDLVPRSTEVDGLRHLFQAAGLLPGEAAYYTDLRILEEDGVTAVQVTGHLDGHPDWVIATRYEVRPCEPGIRIRTELLNGEADPTSWLLSDGWYSGGRESLPFIPAPGIGFEYPSFGLSTVPDALRDVPYFVHGVHPEPATTYAAISCSEPHLTGFISEEVSAIGVGPALVQARDHLVFERFVAVADGPSVASGVDLALRVRDDLFGEPWTTISGRLDAPVGPSMVTTGLRAAVLVSEGTLETPREERVPITHVIPGPNGAFTVSVPTRRPYVIEVESYGRVVAEAEAELSDFPYDFGAIALPAVGELTIDATVDGARDHLLVFVVPADEATEEATRGRMFGRFESCAPLLGHPHSDSPACNRILVDGPTTVSLPPGTYDLLAAAGPFSSLARVADLVVAGGEGQSVQLDVRRLPVLGPNRLSADFHVHGGPSFDASINDHDRVRAFLASGLDVIATTEHDVAWDYSEALAALGATDRLQLMVGTESTGHILFNYIETDTNPAVVGHWNFWPITFDPRGPYRGAAWDEKGEPGVLMQRMRDQAGWDPETGVAQLNHPISGLQLGRAFGWADSLNLDGNLPLKVDDDGTGQAIFLRRPTGDDGAPAAFRNGDYHAQEVMNGTANGDYLKYREFWFYLMDQGIFRAGTGNSDSHSLTENVLGVPRTVVEVDSGAPSFDPAGFNARVRDGRAIATNGPVIEMRAPGAGVVPLGPSITPVVREEPAGGLQFTVSAAPWIRVQELRVFVNHELVRTVPVADPADPLSEDPADFVRLDLVIPWDELLPADGSDAWIVAEAGPPHREAADLDCDAFPDTTDNDGDGRIDWRDVEALAEDPGVDCLPETGPLRTREPPPDREDPLAWFAEVFPGGYPLAVTNPIVIDVDADGEYRAVFP